MTPHVHAGFCVGVPPESEPPLAKANASSSFGAKKPSESLCWGRSRIHPEAKVSRLAKRFCTDNVIYTGLFICSPVNMASMVAIASSLKL